MHQHSREHLDFGGMSLRCCISHSDLGGSRIRLRMLCPCPAVSRIETAVMFGYSVVSLYGASRACLAPVRFLCHPSS